MATDKDLLKQLIKIAQKQQKIIEKLAQQLPGGGDVELGPDHTAPSSVLPPPTDIKPSPAFKNQAAIIIEALGDFYKQNISVLEVHDHNIMVKFLPGKATQPNYDHVKQIVQQLQNKNILQGFAYTVKVIQ